MLTIDRMLQCMAMLPLVGLLDGEPRHAAPSERAAVALRTVAYRVHRMPAMVAFYTEAFDARFREVDARGVRSQFGEIGSLTVKFVPIRDAVDFDGFPVHQLGFEVPDVAAVIAIAERHGGRLQNPLERQDGRIQAAVRDPDGNTIELYGR